MIHHTLGENICNAHKQKKKISRIGKELLKFSKEKFTSIEIMEVWF